MTVEENKKIVSAYWEAFFAKDWRLVAGFFSEDAHYADAGLEGSDCKGPAEIVARLQGLNETTRYGHELVHMIGEGDVVITEHIEQWGFEGVPDFDHPFTSVMELDNGKITRWFDYGNVSHIAEHVPDGYFERWGDWRERIIPIHELWPDTY